MNRVLFLFLVFFNLLFSDFIKVELNWKHQFEFAGFYTALEKGYYKDTGLDVELLERDVSTPFGEKCLKNKVQFFTSYSSVISEIQNKKPYVLVANYLKRSPLALAVKKDILLPKDLKNKIIMASPEEMQSAGFRKMFLENGIKKSDYKFVQNSMELEEFKQGRADAISIYLTNEPYFLRKNKTPFVIMDPSHYGGDLLYDLNLLTTKSYAKEHPDTVKKFVEATNKGWQYALSHKEEIVDFILQKYNTQRKSKEHLLFEADEIEKLMEPDGYAIGSVDLKRIKKIEELYIRLGDAKEYIDPTEFIWKYKIDDNKKISLSKEEKNFIKKHSNITFGVDASWAPYIFVGKDGKLSGYEIEMIKKINSLTGLNINIKVGRWSDMVARAKAHKIDGLTTSAYNKEREDSFLFSTPYNKVKYMVAVAPGNPHSIKHIDDLKNKTIATQKNNLMTIKIAKKLSDKKIVFAQSATDAYNMIVGDEAQATIATEDLWYWIKEKDYKNILPAFSLPDHVGLLYSIRKDWTELKSILDKAIKAIPENEKKALKNKWLLIQGPTENFSQIDEEKKIVLSREEKVWLSKNHTVRVNIAYWPPYMLEYPEPSGMAIDYLRYVAKQHGIALEFVSGSNRRWPETLQDLGEANKFIDLIPTMKRTPDRETKFAMTDDYLFSPWVIIAKEGRTDIDSIDSLNGKTVSVELGFAIEKKLQREYPKIKLQEVPWTLKALEDVATGISDGYVGNLANSTYLIRNYGLNNLKVAAPTPFERHDQAMAIRPDWPQLASIINKTLKAMPQEEHNKILDKWTTHSKGSTSTVHSSEQFLLAPSERNWLQEHGPIRLCVDSLWTPIDYIDEEGKYSGVGAEFISLFAKKIGHKIVNYPAKSWQEVLDAAKEGKCDIVSMIAKTPSREQYLSFTTPYFMSKNVIVTRESAPYIEDLSKFTNEKFGIVRGFASIGLLKEKYPGIKLVEVGSAKEGLKKVADKEIFGYIDIVPVIAWHIQELGLINLKISGDTGISLKLGMGVNKDLNKLCTIFQKAIYSLTKNEKEEILNHYINVRYEKGFDYSMLYKVLFVTVVLFLFIVYHTLQKEKLNKELKQKVQEELEKSRQKDNMIFHQNKLIAMGEMIENIAHQWRQPLSQINASVLVIDNAMMEKGFESKRIEKELDDIERMTKYMSHTIDDFRSLFAEDKTKENLNLQEVAGTAISIIHSSLKYHRINLILKKSVKNYMVQGYKNDLMQVILVILNNAKDVLVQTKKDDPKIVIQIECNDKMVDLKICDNGGGIGEQNIDKIFEPYFTTKHKAQGTGLGLYISKIIIEQGMEGKLEVENSGEGACFSIKFKAIDA